MKSQHWGRNMFQKSHSLVFSVCSLSIRQVFPLNVGNWSHIHIFVSLIYFKWLYYTLKLAWVYKYWMIILTYSYNTCAYRSKGGMNHNILLQHWLLECKWLLPLTGFLVYSSQIHFMMNAKRNLKAQTYRVPHWLSCLHMQPSNQPPTAYLSDKFIGAFFAKFQSLKKTHNIFKISSRAS